MAGSNTNNYLATLNVGEKQEANNKNKSYFEILLKWLTPNPLHPYFITPYSEF